MVSKCSGLIDFRDCTDSGSVGAGRTFFHFLRFLFYFRIVQRNGRQKLVKQRKFCLRFFSGSFSLKNPVSSASFGSSNSFDSAKFCRHPFDYGQILKIEVLPVTGIYILRANLRNRHFARNGELHFTGKFKKSTFCP